MLMMARPRVVWVGIKRRFEFGGEVLIGGVLQITDAQGGGHLRPLYRICNDASPHHICALPYCVERCCEPCWSNTGVAVGGADHAVWATNREQAAARFVHQEPTRMPDICLMWRKGPFDNVQGK